MLQVLAEENFPVGELIPIASARSAGKKVEFRGREYTVVTPEVGLSMQPSIAIFSAGGGTSLEWAEKFAATGCYVIDNSSAWRMDPTKKLVIPEINAGELTAEDRIIANPNCSTIQMLVALAPLHKAFGIKRIVVSTYQAVTGTGKAAVDQLMGERRGEDAQKVYKHKIDLNCIPHCDDFTENGYTKEEMKLVNETHKILDDSSITVSPTAVRVPVVGGHSESINVEFLRDFTLTEARAILEKSSGVTVQDNPSENLYPMPLSGHGQNDVFVGRLRMDISNPRALNMWVVADNLRKGAATNAVQIAQYILRTFLQ